MKKIAFVLAAAGLMRPAPTPVSTEPASWPEPQIIDQPNHPLYGPTRRLWVVIQTLFADELDRLDGAYYAEWGGTWQEDFEFFCDASHNTIQDNQREVISRLFAAIGNM